MIRARLLQNKVFNRIYAICGLGNGKNIELGLLECTQFGILGGSLCISIIGVALQRADNGASSAKQSIVRDNEVSSFNLDAR